mmetsp:Transcript_127980/g.370351  ORF Transcript_127980/g.370351 Transcript_127980/m.370351 type:complete len:258 (+) Transcript_127980:1030-1803(+)
MSSLRCGTCSLMPFSSCSTTGSRRETSWLSSCSIVKSCGSDAAEGALPAAEVMLGMRDRAGGETCAASLAGPPSSGMGAVAPAGPLPPTAEISPEVAAAVSCASAASCGGAADKWPASACNCGSSPASAKAERPAPMCSENFSSTSAFTRSSKPGRRSRIAASIRGPICAAMACSTNSCTSGNSARLPPPMGAAVGGGCCCGCCCGCGLCGGSGAGKGCCCCRCFCCCASSLAATASACFAAAWARSSTNFAMSVIL